MAGLGDQDAPEALGRGSPVPDEPVPDEPALSQNSSSLSRSRSNARLPRAPLTSIRSAFLRPVANRVASKEARAPDSSRPVNATASSTVTGPVAPGGPPGRGRSGTNVAVTAETPAISCPVRYWARSTMCAPRSPSAPEPACSFCSRQVSGKAGSASQSCR